MFVIPRNRLWRLTVVGIAASILVYAVFELVHEINTSERQAQLLSDEAKSHFFWLESGPASNPLSAPDGPLDQQRGTTDIPYWTERLAMRGYEVTRQATASPSMAASSRQGLYPAYDPAPQAGLTITGRDGTLLYDHKTPGEVFDDLDELPDLLVDTLLFIENRELLEPGYEYRNPAIEWRRFAHAFVALVQRELGVADDHFGGSTLATQLQKFRHSSGGVTDGEAEKLRQMLSAALRAYRHGPNTYEHQRLLVLEYLNGVPLAASPRYGEVQGLPDGLRVWFGTDPDDVVRRLNHLEAAGLETRNDRRGPSPVSDDDARAFRKVLSLFLAHRRPSHYLVDHSEALAQLTDSYLRVLAGEGVIGSALRDAALAVDAPVQRFAPPADRPHFSQRKAVDATRSSLAEALDADDLYQLDRYDLYVESTIDGAAQRAVDAALDQLDDPDFVDEHRLVGPRLLHPNAALDELTVSLTVYEQTAQGNALRILADNHDQPLNINEHVKLDLGSTAKLRTLVTYLETIEKLHRELADKPKSRLDDVAESAPDGLRRWTAQTLSNSDDRSIEATLDAAMQRPYSANPNQTFFTGGGRHKFSNFEHRRNHTQSVSEAFRHSVNLVFIRMMRDIVDYYQWLDPERRRLVLGDEDTDERHYLLSRFADMEGTHFQVEFYERYADLAPRDIPHAVVEDRTLSAASLAMIALAFSETTDRDLQTFVAEYSELNPGDDRIDRWRKRYSPDALSWQDRGHLTNIHPLELWTAAWLHEHPNATFDETIVASRDVRQEVYQWLFRTRSRARQDHRLRTVLEAEAFDQIHHAWRRLGYPFDNLVPSLATSIGSSADRPIALAELVGIIHADGVRKPEIRFDTVVAGFRTPYETHFELREAPEPRRLLSKPVARVLQTALVDVVERGTGRRVHRQLTDGDGEPVVVGGKTGTGDHDHEVYDGLRLVESRPVHRTATFAFTLDDRFFGTITAFVSDEAAGEFTFTSALPLALLNTLNPAFQHLLDGDERTSDTDRSPPGPRRLSMHIDSDPDAIAATGDNTPSTKSVETAPIGWDAALDTDPATDLTAPQPSSPTGVPVDWNDLFVPSKEARQDGEPSARVPDDDSVGTG